MKDIKWIHFSLNQIEELICKYAFMHFIWFINLFGLARGWWLAEPRSKPSQETSRAMKVDETDKMQEYALIDELFNLI
jgi:hypothetical protein